MVDRLIARSLVAIEIPEHLAMAMFILPLKFYGNVHSKNWRRYETMASCYEVLSEHLMKNI